MGYNGNEIANCIIVCGMGMVGLSLVGVLKYYISEFELHHLKISEEYVILLLLKFILESKL